MEFKAQQLRLVFLLVNIVTAGCVNSTHLLNYSETTNITDIIKYINKVQNIQVNVLVNLGEKSKTSEYFAEVLRATELPKLVVNNETYLKSSTSLYDKFNRNSLTIAWLRSSNINVTLTMLDHILWRIHFKDIFLIYQHEVGDKSTISNKQLMTIFQGCWNKGFISVLLWTQHQLYTYHPYPRIKVVRLKSVDEFVDKTHLNNFQQYSCPMPFFDFPNLCYSYTNRQGKLVRTGYFYKWVQLYLEYYNASIDYYFIDMWAENYTKLDAANTLNELGYCLLPIFISRNPDYFEMSDALHLTSVTLMVPGAKEISASLYLVVPYKGFIWFIIIVSSFMFFFLIYYTTIGRNRNITKDFGKMALQAFSIILFLGIDVGEKRSVKHFYFNLLFLFTGIFLTNFYTSNLSSLHAAKVYEPELKTLTDIGRTNLKILEHSVDIPYMQSLDLPKELHGRFITGGNTELPLARLSLNMSYMYSTHNEFVDFLLFQQYYLKHPIAKKLDQEMYSRHHYVTVPHRSPLIDHFNRYISRIRENGMLEKFIADTKWDGVLSGYLTFVRDPDDRKPLKLEHFRYAFVIWFCGLSGALMIFLFELKMCVLKRRLRNN